MPNFGQTPEALLGRNDSKNVATTCRGLTSSGRSCRRALAAPKSSPIARRKPAALGGVVAMVTDDDDGGEDGEAALGFFYCWQHRDQAEARLGAERQGKSEDDGAGGGGRKKRRSPELVTLRERSSIDTMVQRLGLEAVPEEGEGKARRKQTRNPRPPGRTEGRDFAAQGAYGGRYEVDLQPTRRRPKKAGFWASLCCMATIDEDDYVEVVRRRKRTEQERPAEMANTVSTPPPRIPGNKPSDSRRPPSTTAIPARKPVTLPLRPAPQQRSSSNPHTTQFLSLIPPHLSPQTTSALLAELIKPISPHDEEGYIYIFWLTPQSRQAPAEETARSLLASPAHSPSQRNDRRISDVLTEYSFEGSDEPGESRDSDGGGGNGKRTIMLKIGRANNVTRRMNEWQRQCGYALNLVRWYPYIALSPSFTSSPQESPTRHTSTSLYPDFTQPPPSQQQQQQQRRQGESAGVRKVPCVKRVERLIHLELQDKQVKRRCEACGKEHREWFAVEASQAGVRGMDECVRRWVGWAEREGGT
ncbi:hypothetical protein B0A55_03473 [Friedmanniomyces simplex]|uniref:Bacteriophage T5 Orf172 DNA-binding domain-containing protein n=1 Tax=Friedmanniomyces simplex TaxID=329884 RepID=A0A4U0XRV5_9PEZI|nr:hypothetical protein B0A55_03473 [Friedmanniomyces simplex]